MRVIVAGSRGLSSPGHMEKIYAHLDRLLPELPITSVVSGHARGPDQIGEAWADERGLPVQLYPADWERYGRSAGFRRNQLMALNADALVAFWDGSSRGTRHMIDLARAAGLKVTVFNSSL